jgi:hypothetical protein
MTTFFDIPTSQIIHRLINRKKLKPIELDKIQNILFNFGFSLELQLYFMDKFQYANPVHRGILLSLLLQEKHNRLSPFYPLQKYPDADAKIAKITGEWEKELLEVLKKTERHEKPAPTGMKPQRKTRRRLKLWSF